MNASCFGSIESEDWIQYLHRPGTRIARRVLVFSRHYISVCFTSRLKIFLWWWWYQSEIGFSAVSAVRWPQPLRHKIYIWTIFIIRFNDMKYIWQRKFSHQYIYGNLTPCACRKVLQRVVRSPEIESWIYPSSTWRRFRVVFSRSRQSNSNFDSNSIVFHK